MASLSARRPHAVVVPYPAQGHINPCMQLAKQLALQHYTITFVNTEHNHERIVASQPQQADLLQEEGLNIRFAHIPDGLPHYHDRMSSLSTLSHAIDTHMPAPFEALVTQLCSSDDSRPTCIVSDVFMLFTQDIANKFGLPRVAVWFQSAASFAIHVHMPSLISQGYAPFTVKSRKDLITSIPGHPPLSPEDLPSFFKDSDASNYMFKFKLLPFQRLQEAKCVLINTFDDLERSVLKALNEDFEVLAAGPFLPPALLANVDSKDNRTGAQLWPEDHECLPWLDSQKESSVLYISFGSIASLSEVQFKELVLGLEASERPLLWAIRPDVKNSIASALPKTFLEGGLVYITPWAPQSLVLSHKSVGGFLTHCGWNSTLESLSMGVPTLAWPYFADQMMNRKWMVEEWKVGKSFEATDQGLVTKEEVERLVRLLMEGKQGQEMGKRARKLSLAAKKAVQHSGSSLVNVQNVLKVLM
ncbi:hypothetical protein GOP47_0024909 [Adiantum capillus-veneris]|uniref:Glycosyltransferase n=1 Tax=Adiantum capillus-veneris TaxID=13818 RepID=A0A9D4Z426_ADICA|nr:hypothetical protein GOP47_0024909 [Adiantum capillus-veneris]